MRRVRLLRWLLLGLLVPFLALVVLTVRRPVPPSGARQALPPRAQTRAEEVQAVQVQGGRASLALVAERVEAAADGSFRLEGVRRIELQREDAPPLRIRANEGHVSGQPGAHRIELRGAVEFVDEAAGLHLTMEGIEVDEEAMQARSMGEVHFRSGGHRGRAARVLYPLGKGPIILEHPEIEDGHGGWLRAQQGALLDGTRSVEFEGSVELERPGAWLRCSRARVLRDEQGRMREAELEGLVEGVRESPPRARLAADRVQLAWDERGEARAAIFAGAVRLEYAGRELSAERVAAHREQDVWSVEAGGAVEAVFAWEGHPATLEAERLEATLDREGGLLAGTASGGVRYRARGVEAEGARARLEAGQAVLESGAGLRARLAQGPFRVAAERIRLDPRGSTIQAQRRVEATRLDSPKAGAAWFGGSGPVHFVAQRMEGAPAEGRVRFAGAVRAWQGERTLAAEEVRLDEGEGRLRAEGGVRTRLPRNRGVLLAEGDFIEVEAQSLDYDAGRGLAVYRGEARLRLAEGWVEAAHLEVVRGAGGVVDELRAAQEVRFEFRAPEPEGLPVPVRGTGDRLHYAPASGWVELYGERRPARVERQGPTAEVTEARVIRYQVQTGALDVAAGARVRTGSSPPPEPR